MTFLPRVGGLENIMAGLAEEWQKKGNEVTVFTSVPSDEAEKTVYKIKRGQSLGQLWKAVKQADIFIEANISLKTFWIGLLHRKKWFVAHHLPYSHDKSWKGILKNYITRFSNNISCSQYIAKSLAGKSSIINNFYNSAFKLLPDTDRNKQLVFVGRLVSDKGVDLLLHALKMVNTRGFIYKATIIGDGPEREKLQILAKSLGIGEQINFEGILRGDRLVTEINRHMIMVIPSKWDEPYGIVALEGLACGCRIVCSSGGGLPEAVAGFGFLFPNNDVEALSTRIMEAMNAGNYNEKELADISIYLQQRTVDAISGDYLKMFKKNVKQ